MEQLNLKVKLNDNGSITASWDKIKGAVRYEAYMYPYGKDYHIYNESNLTTTSYTSKPNLPANQQYMVVVAAYDKSYLLASDGKKILIHADFYKAKTLGVPQNVKAVPSTITVKVSYDKVANAAGYDILFDGKVYSVTGTSKTFTGLKPKTNHTYAVRAKNSGRTGAYSTTKTVTTLPQTPAVPSGIKKAVTENSITISWAHAVAATSYEIVINGATYTTTLPRKVISMRNPNTTYKFKIRSVNADAVSAYCKEQTVTTAPKIPDATVTTSESTVKVSWTAVPGATSYDVLFNGKVYNVKGTSKTFTKLPANAGYTCQVRARGAGGASTYSGEKTIKTTPKPPTSPNLSATKTVVTISWDAVPGATSYDVVFNGNTYRVTKPFASFYALTAGTKYSYKIRVNNADGSSSYSALKYITTLPNPPGNPTNITATATTNTVTIKWKAATGATSYDVEVENTTYNVTGTAKKITGLKPGRKYSYRVRANNAGGSSSYSYSKNIMTALTKPGVPQNISAKAKSYSVKVKWDAVEIASGYDLWFGGKVYNVVGTSYDVTDLTPSKSYKYKVRAKNKVGAGAYSAVKTVKTLVKPVDPPENIRATATKDTVTITWDEVKGASAYMIRLGFVYHKVSVPSIALSTTFDECKPDTNYGYSVCSVNEVGEGEYSEEQTIRTLPIIPYVPSGIVARPTASSVTVEWEKSPSAESYDLLFNGTVYNSTNENETITGLEPNTEYVYQVRAKNEEGDSEYSEEKTVRTLLETPTHICAKAKSKTVTITFDPVEGATDYDIVFDQKTYSTTETSKEFTGLEPITSYGYIVRARNEYVESEYSKKAIVTTFPPGPDVPSDVFAATTMNEVIVSFSPVEDATDYDVEFDGIPYHIEGGEAVTVIGEETFEREALEGVKYRDPGASCFAMTSSAALEAIWELPAEISKIYVVFTGLEPDTKHFYCARANNHEGSSPYSTPDHIWTQMGATNGLEEKKTTRTTYPGGRISYTGADPVNALTGAFLWSYTWLEDYGKDKLHFTTMYDSQRDASSGVLGRKWTYSLNYLLKMDEKCAYFSTPYGGTIPFLMDAEKGSFEAVEGFASGYSMSRNGDGFYSVKGLDGNEYVFDANCCLNRIVENGLEVYRFHANDKGQIVCIEGRHGARMNLSYKDGRIVSVADALGNVVSFTYKSNCPVSAVNPDGKEMKFNYDKAYNMMRICDFSGYSYLTNEYDAKGRVTEQNTVGRGTSFVDYDENNRVTTFTDELGNATKYFYDENGRITKVELAGNVIQNSYNENGQLTKQVDALGNVTKMSYDERGRMNQVIHPDGAEEKIVYNDRNLPVKVVGRDGTETLYRYDERNNLIAMQDERGNSSSYTYDENDNLVCSTDKTGKVWNYAYDENNHLKQAVDPEGNVYQYSHDAIGRLTLYTSPAGKTISYRYSATGDLLSIEDADGTMLFEYDENGSRTGITDRLGNKQRLEYNEMGQVSLATDFMGNEYRFVYDAKGNLIREIDPLGSSEHFKYDAMGNRTAWTDKNGNITSYSFDAANQLTEVKNAAGGTLNYTYDTMGQVKTVTDPLGHQTAYAYDKAGRVISVTDALGNSVSYTYDEAGNLLTKTDEEGTVTAYCYDEENRLLSIQTDVGNVRFAYDGLGRVIAVEDAEGNIETATYDEDGNLVAASDKESNKTTYVYDATGHLVEETAPNGGRTLYAYDKNGNCIKVTDAENNEYVYEYDANNRPVKVTNPLKQETTYTYDAVGKLVSVTDARGGKTSFEYDSNGNLIWEVNPLGGVKIYTYDNLNRLTETMDEEGHKHTFMYDAAGNMTSYIDANENQWTCDYDALNRMTSVTEQDGGKLTLDYTKTGKIAKVTDQEGAETSYLYDSMGRLLQMSDAMGHSLSFTYDSLGRMLTQTDANGNTTEYEYSPVGNLLSVKEPEGNLTTYTYNALGQILTATDPLGNVTSYTYDALGQVLSITDAEGGKTSFTYTATGQIATVTDANGGVTEYTYDACGNLTQTIDPLGNTVAYEYDAMNNQIKECLSASGEQTCVTLYQYDKRGCVVREIDPMSEEKAYTYDGNGNIVTVLDEEKNETIVRYDLNNRPVQVCYSDGKETTFRYNKRGELVEMKDWNGMVSMEHDSLGRLKKVTEHDGRTIGYNYDAVGNRTAIHYPDGSEVSYAYDKNNRLTGVTDAEGKTTQYAYDMAGNIISISQPGSTTAYTYNANRKPVQVKYQLGDGTFMEDSIVYDAMGRIIGSERKGSTTELTRSAAYTYDAIGQLLSCREGQNTETYVYDALGNRISKAVNGSQKSTYQYNPMNQLTAIIEDGIGYSFGYDRRGNLTEERKGDNPIRRYTYDVTNRMVLGKNLESGETTEYSYNGLAMRIKNVQTLTEDGKSRIKEMSYVVDYLSRDRNDLMAYETGVGSTKSVYGRGYERLSRKVIPETPSVMAEKSYFQSDLYGSPLFAVNEAGALSRYAERGIWGDVKFPMSGKENSAGVTGDAGWTDSFRFTNYCYDPVVDKYFAQARFYDRRQGRMLAKDPVKQGLNAYPYCGNDPVNYVDPSGKIPLFLTKVLLGGATDAVCEFAGSTISQLRSGEKYDFWEAVGCAAKGFVTGSVKEALMIKDAGKVLSFGAEFIAGTAGSATRQKLSGEKVNWLESMTDGLANAVGGSIMGNKPFKSAKDAWKKGSRAGGATSIIENLGAALSGRKSGVAAGAGTGMLGLALNYGVSQIQMRDPRTGCGSINPFSNNLSYSKSYGYRQRGNRVTTGSGKKSGFSLKDFAMDVAADTVLGGLGGLGFYKVGKHGAGAGSERGTGSVNTPYGTAIQSNSKEAMQVKGYVENGGMVYRGGTLNRSKTTDAQFWAPESPVTSGYADKYGVDFSKMDYIIGGYVKDGTGFITRPAPGLGNNAGGAIEIVTPPNSVDIKYFYMIGGQ